VPGTRLGPYEILSSLGEGGMGDVYRARDTRLDRIVALKISKEEFTPRFETETRDNLGGDGMARSCSTSRGISSSWPSMSRWGGNNWASALN
jgi:serine/threonine protein kinase